MTSVNSGAVFFLGSRAHYQVLTPPSSHSYDLDNGNTSSETIYHNTSSESIYRNSTLEWPNDNQKKNTGNFLYNEKDTVIDMPKKSKEFDYDGVKKRLRKYRKQDGSSEMILNDNDDSAEYNPSDLNDVNSDKKPTKRGKRTRSLAFLLSLLSLGRRPTPRDQCLQLDTALRQCTYRDTCRCDDCQSRYFECDDSDDDYSMSDGSDYIQQQYNEQYIDYSAPQYAEYAQYLQDCNECSASCRECSPGFSSPCEVYSPTESQADEEAVDEEEDDDEEVFINSPPAVCACVAAEPPPPPAALAPPAPAPAVDVDEQDVTLEFVAGGPLVLSHILSTPLTCAVM